MDFDPWLTIAIIETLNTRHQKDQQYFDLYLGM